MNIRLTHIDGKLPNLALMKLAHYHREQGDKIHLARTVEASMFELDYDIVYGSAIFQWSTPMVDRLIAAFPDAITGGTGTSAIGRTVESIIGVEEYEHYDYSPYPDFPYSLGFTQRGCRLNCGFCVVPKKEGKPKTVNTIEDIWRPGSPRCVILLDNDFFGQPREAWEARLEELRQGQFKVSFNQGINIRMITEESAQAIASVQYSDDQFKTRRLYTAWDNLGQEDVFFKGLAALEGAGIPASHVMVYMLIGYNPVETMDDILYRFQRLVDAGCLPYPMVFNNLDKQLKRFQRWAVGRYYQVVAWEEYNPIEARRQARIPPQQQRWNM